MIGDEKKRDVSEFNSAVLYLNRLNILFSNADESAISLDMYTWFHSLLALFRELSTEMKQEEINALQQKLIGLRNKLNVYISNRNRTGTNEVNPDLYHDLHTFELVLRAVMKVSGLQQKIIDAAGKALK